MKKLLFLLLLCPYLLATQCFDDECELTENWEQNSYVPLVNISPLQTEYSSGDKITISVSVPSNNEFFGESLNILETSGDETGLLQLVSVEGKDDLFLNNEVTINKGSQGRFSTWFEMPFNEQTGNYEFEAEITLNRTGSYTQFAEASVDFGASSSCPDYTLNILYMGVEEQFVEFSVAE